MPRTAQIDRKIRETRTAEQLRAEVVEGERRSLEKHAKLAAEASSHRHIRKGQVEQPGPLKEAHEGGE